MRIFSSLVVVHAVGFAIASVQAVPVSVCRDATYDIPADRGQICVGSGAQPVGTACPLKGQVSSQDCHDNVPSLTGTGSCVAIEDAVCAIVNGDTWGCVFPSIGCQESECPTWDYENEDVVDLDGSVRRSLQEADGSDGYDESWFVQMDPVSPLYACDRRPTPAPTTFAPVTPAPTTSAPVTPAPTTPAPVTPAPTTPSPTTAGPVTPAPTTPKPTPAPTTPKPTPAHTTPKPTPAPTTPVPVTPAPTTPNPTPATTTPAYPTEEPTPASTISAYAEESTPTTSEESTSTTIEPVSYSATSKSSNTTSDGIQFGWVAIAAVVVAVAVIGGAFYATKFRHRRQKHTTYLSEIVLTPV